MFILSVARTIKNVFPCSLVLQSQLTNTYLVRLALVSQGESTDRIGPNATILL